MELKLPPQVASKRDLVKLLREIEELIDAHTQARVAEEKAGHQRDLPKPSRVLRSLLEANSLESSDESLNALKSKIRELKDRAPKVRISFSSEPDQRVTEDLVSWFRREISPVVLVQIGVQPTIAGGAVLRTPMRRMDFSLRKQLLASSDKLSGVLRNVG